MLLLLLPCWCCQECSYGLRPQLPARSSPTTHTTPAQDTAADAARRLLLRDAAPR